jgi:hypothetical protein
MSREIGAADGITSCKNCVRCDGGRLLLHEGICKVCNGHGAVA